jgi:hypothetical protein|nr:MAG TPA: Type I restriction enzyme Methylase [Bacteriophage sp.]
MALNYLDKAAWDAGVYKDKGNDDDTQQDTSSEDSGFSASGILSAAKNFLEHPFQGTGTVIAPNYTPRPLDDSVYSDIPGTPVAIGQFGELEDESVRDERMKDSADYMAANWPRLYGGVVAADEGLANVVGGIQNAVGGGNGILTNVQRAEEGMQDYRDQWNNEYGDSYFLTPNKFATDVGSGIGSTVPIMALSALMPGAAVAGGTRALTSALSRAGLGRLAMSEAGQALIADTVRSPISSLADSLSEYGTVVNDMMQNGMSEDEARRRAIPMFFKNMALDTFTVPLELGVMKGGKGIATGLLGRSAGEGMAKSIAKGAARTGMLAGASGLTEGYQEGAQNALENDVEGKRDGGWYNPFTWTNEDWEAARGGFVGGALMGVPGNVAAGFHSEARQAPLSAESQEQAQSIKDTLSHGKPAGMSNAAYNAYIELANSGNPDLIKQAASSLESLQQSQEGSQESTDDAATEAYKDYEAYDQKQEIENFLNNNTVEQIGGEKNFNWLMGVLRNGTPEEVQHAYDTVIAAEKATAEQEAKNRPASGGGSMSPNTGNAMANIVIQAANDSGVEPRLGLAIAARESGGDDVNAISMPEPHDGVYGVMQAQEETVSNMGLDSQYPDWKTDPYQNAMVGMAILKAKIDGENGDVWAGVRDYDGAGEEAEQYRQLVKNNYDNMGDIGGGGSGNVEAPSEAFYDLSEAMNPQVDGMDPNTMAKMNLLARDFYQKYGHRLLVTSLKRNGDGSSYHDEGHAFDFSDDFLEQNTDARDWLVQQGEKYGLKGLDEFSHPVATTDGGNVHFTDHGGPAPGGASSGVSGKVTSDNGQFERELDQAAQEAKSDMDKIQAQSDQAINEIMNDDSTEKTAQDAQQDAENAQKQAEEGQQSVQGDVVPDVSQTIRDTSNNIDEINTLDGMFTKDSNGNDKFIDTPENRDFIKTNYKDEIAKAVNDAMSKKKAPSATPVPKSQQQTSHTRLGRILSTYDHKDPKFKEYMNTFRNGTEQEQQKLADDLQTTQELERANSLKGNPLTTQQDQNIPQNVPQQAVEAPKQTEQVNTPVQEKESLETQKKRKIYLAKKQKLMERVPAGKTVKVHASTNDAGFDATYKIAPAGDITASHDMNYAVNDLYPAEYQPRDRNRPQMRGQVEKMTKGMKPELLAESQFVNEGAPVINNSGVVLNGNGRVMAVQKAYKGLTDAHKKSAKAYKDYLVSIAPSLGIAPEKVQSMDHPVLVRQAADNADTNAIINSTEPAGSGRVHQQEAGRVQSQEKEGNEVDEKSKQSDHVDTEPQQTESKDTEGTHAEEGSQGDVQEEISKFHNVLDDEKSTPKQVIDAYKSVVDKVIASADGSRKNAKMGDKIVTDEYQSLTNSKHWNAFMNEDGGRNWHEVATINADAHRALHAIINTAGVKAKEAPSSQGILPYKQAADDIMDRLDHKKLTPARAINKLKIIMKDANAARWGEFKAMEAIESKEKLSFDDYKMALDLANDAMKKANDMRLEASRNRKARKTAKELESATKETQNDADIRFGTVDDAEKAVMEAFGVKPHKKPADTSAVPRKASTKDTPKKAAQKAVIKDDTKIEKTFHLLDDSDEALEAEKKAILEELSHLSVNPAFNPVLMYHLLKVGAIHVQRGLNEFAHWAKAMKDTLPQSEPFLRSVWDSLQSMPNDANLDEKQLTAAIRYVGSLYDHGMTDKVDLRKSFIATLGVKNAKYFDAVYNAVMEYPSIEELKGANVNVNRNVSELVARSGEGTSENAVGESRVQGRTAVRGSRQDTAPAGKESEEPGMGHDSVPGSSPATGRTAGNRRVQTQESKDSAGSTGSAELPGSVRAGLERVPDDDQRRPAELVRAAQNRPQHEDPVEKVQEEQKDKHLNEIKKALPMLLPQQAEDVCIAEDRFKKHSGMMFTNGTGTGKTYTGLGIVKRFVDANKKNILIIAPSDGILKQWEEAAAKDFGITLTRLNSTKDAGKGAVTATYTNVGANQALVNRDFDLVITDESHNLMGSESATPTDALKLVRAVTGHKDGFQRYHHDKHPEISSKLDKLHEEIKKLHKQDNQNSKAYNETHDPSLADESRGIRNQIEKLEEEQSKWHKKLEAFKDADEKAFAEKQPSKVLFLSATPFQYVTDLDYANGYLFNYSDYGPMDEQGYNRANGREIFYMENFGYKMRYNRLERPSADVDTDLMEREFNRKMVESGAMHGRMLSSAYDYDRGFIRVDAGIGKKIDEGFDWLRDQPKYSELSDFLRGRFTGQQKYYLLEAIKAKQAIPLIKEYLKEGKKVVIFHNFNKGGADNPFAISKEGMDHLERLDSELADHILEQYHEFQAERPDLADLDLNDLESPIETLSKAFGDELALYNGTLSKGEREKNKNAFNNDDSKTKIILVQSAAGQAGVSLHDTTGKYQRALINLGLPTKPSEAIQQEGRIYRVGNKSNAIFRYLNTGTYMEQTAFATKLAERAGTVENIALGEMARSLKQAYVEAFEESQEGDGWKKYLPGSKTEGTGGKTNDYRQEKATDFDRAKAVYFGKQKKNSRTKSQEGHDYFATPEPIGYKMVQWLQSKPGQSLLEPSAGDGAIARWMPDNTYNTVVEPSRDLTPKLMRNVAGAKVVESTFENFDLHNKFDGIAMNPPFGHGGKTAVEHVAKAYQHLKDGGRLIAIIPDGPACQKHFDKWFYGDPEAKRKEDRGIADGVLMADIHLPSVTFDRAGTKVNTRMVVIDKYTDEGTRQIAEAEARGRIDIAADDANELFDRIEGMNMPERLDMSDEKKQASIRKAGQQLTRSKEDLKVEIKEAFPNAKEIKDEGDRMTFTMPNGSHIVVDVKNEILLTDEELAQAKKDHHVDDNGNVVVEGYAQLHGKDAYMALSQGSRENTGFHEAYHLAEGAVLTDREKAAIKKAIPDAEKRADKYAEWVEARKHGRGTAWGKLFQKIKDFAAKMKRIFTRTETVNDIFRQIESGKVWERDARDNNERRYAARQEDQEEAPVKPQDIIDAINDIVHIYEGSRLTDKERKELRESSKFDPDQKQAVRPQATDLYDRHAHAGFNRMGYFNLSNYGRILALHLDNIMQLKGNLELANKVLDRQDKNAAENKMNGVNEHLTPAQARQNAVMDFGAMMIRNPELARETYPAYSKIFDEGLEQHPDLKEKLDKVIQLNETYQGQTAAERAAGSIAREKGKVQLRKHPKEWLSTHFDKLYTNWVDDKHAFAKVVARAEAELGRKLAYDYDVHKQAQMAINVASSRALLFLTGGKGVEETYKVLNKVYGHAITKNVTMKDIMDALNKVSKEDVSKTGAENAYDALGNYLIAMRTEELEKHYHDAYARSAGFDEEGTREIIQNTPESIKKIAQMYWDINTNIVNILQQQGLISKDLAGKLRKYKHYCPMYRDMSDGITDMDEMIGTIGVFNKGGGYANVSNGIKRIEGGGKRPILDPITSLSQMAVSMISKCERNDVAKTFVKLGQDFAGLGDVVVRDPTLKHADPTAFAFTVWQNGEQVVYRTTPEIYDALTNNDAQTNRFTIKMASSIAQTLRTGATISPSFIVRNLLRDTMSATVNSKTGFYLPFVDNVRGAWKLHFDKEFSAEYHASGASMSTYMRADADSSRDLTKELLGHKYDSYPVVVKQVRQLISYAWHKYEKFGNLIEDSTRAGEFRRARNQGLSIDQAGQLAREITLDFSRHGKKGQMINKYVPFFNATIQGTDKFIRTFKDNPMRAILNTVIWIILPSLGLWAINHDDDWYKELDENTKYTNWAIPLPGGTHLLIPKPQEVGILFGSGIEAVLNQMTGTDPHGMKEWARQYAEAMTPSLYPAVVRPLIEWMTNYSFWTGRNLVPASLQKAPSEMQFTSYTSELAKSLGDTWLAKSIKLSPIAIDNWISGWFGSAGRFIANMLNDPISYVRGNSRPSEPAKYWYEMPVIGSFVRQNGQNSEYVNRMYEIQKDMNDDYERSDAGKQRKGKKSSSNKPKELKQVDTAVSSVSKLNKEIKAIRNDPKKDPDRKRQEIDQRRTKINDLAKKVVLKFDK